MTGDSSFVLVWEGEWDGPSWRLLLKALEKHLGPDSSEDRSTDLDHLGFPSRAWSWDDGRHAVASLTKFVLEGEEWRRYCREAVHALEALLVEAPVSIRATGVNYTALIPAVGTRIRRVLDPTAGLDQLVQDEGGVNRLHTTRPLGHGTLNADLQVAPTGGGLRAKLNWHEEHDASDQALDRLGQYDVAAGKLESLLQAIEEGTSC
jgi:hypothetical protein